MIETTYICNKCKHKQNYSMEEVDVCTGYKQSIDAVEYKMFEHPIRGKVHLCEKCYIQWSKLTCLFVYPKTIHNSDRVDKK